MLGLLSSTALLGAGALATAGSALADTAPTVTIGAPSGATPTTVKVSGAINPNGGPSATTWAFEYSKEPLSEGWSTASGVTVGGEYPEGSPESTALTPQAVAGTIEGLQPNATYQLRLVATNAGGETASAEPNPTFATGVLKPAIESVGASGQTPFAATVEGQVNPENQLTTFCQFEYGQGTSTGTTAECEPASLEGFGEQRLSANLTGLQPATKYKFKLTVDNATAPSTREGEFETLKEEPPIVESETFSNLTSTGAILEAQVNPDYLETTYAFEYATNEAMTGTLSQPDEAALSAGFGAQLASVRLTGLTPRTTYYYRVAATNNAGTVRGPNPPQSFTTLATPAVTINEAADLTRTTATLSGTVNPAGAETTYDFAYLEQNAYEAAVEKSPTDPFALAKTTPSVDAGAGYAVQDAGPTTIRELTPGTTYRYAIVATNSLGTTFEPVGAFTTAAPTPPLVSTGEATGVTQLSAIVTGSVNTTELQTNAQFEFGTTPEAGSLVPATIEPSEGPLLTISAAFANDLLPGTTYYYRVVASSQDGTSYGSEHSFTTGTFPYPFASFTTPALLPVPPTEVKPVVKPTTVTTKPLTKAQRLAKALKACKKEKQSKRAGCVKQARKKYAPAKKK